MRRLFSSFVSRIVFGMLGISVPLVVIFYLLITQYMSSYAEDEFITTVRSKARLVSELLAHEHHVDYVHNALDDLLLSGEVVYAAYQEDSEVLLELRDMVTEDFHFVEDFQFGENDDGVYSISVPLYSGNKKAIVRMAFNEAHLENYMTSIKYWGATGIAAYLFILLPSLIFIAIALTRSLRSLQEKANNVAAGEVGQSLKIETNIHEVNALSKDLELMRKGLIQGAEKVRQQSLLHHAVLENIAECILTLDDEGIVESINNATSQMLGYYLPDIKGKHLSSIIMDKTQTICCKPGGDLRVASEQPAKAIHKNGDRIHVLVSVNAFMYESRHFYTVVIQDISERMVFERELSKLAYYDPLTELPNRRLFLERFDETIAYAESRQQTAALMLLDLDRFKEINDTFGHAVGDKLLQLVTQRLVQHVRTDDTVARLGGDEFTVVLADIGESEDAAKVAEAIVRDLSRAFHIEGREVFISASIGVTIFPDDTHDINELIRNADIAMYYAKAAGKAQYLFFDHSMHESITRKNIIENDLRYAIECNQLEVYYQPKVECAKKEIVAAEALLRWSHPELGMVSPAEFIPIAEESMLIVEIGEWVFQQACKQQKIWRDAGLPVINIAVNLSARQLQQKNIAQRFFEIINETGVDANNMAVEITEHMMLHDKQEVATILKELKSRGLMISIDDFGTGHSSLSNLKNLPIDEVKIDRSFISNINSDEQDATITNAIIDMAHTLGLKVVAEGVENKEQLEYLCCKKCDLVQGFYFSEPVPSEKFAMLLVEGIDSENLNNIQCFSD